MLSSVRQADDDELFRLLFDTDEEAGSDEGEDSGLEFNSDAEAHPGSVDDLLALVDELDSGHPAAAAAEAPASASHDVPPPPVPPMPAADRPAGRSSRAVSSTGPQTAALANATFGIGRISFYKEGHDKFRFRAVCNQHPGCQLSQLLPQGEGQRARPGRPLGLMAAWLDPTIAVESRHEHRNPFFMASLDREVRKAARQKLKQAPGAQGLFDREKGANPGEDSEPEDAM